MVLAGVHPAVADEDGIRQDSWDDLAFLPISRLTFQQASLGMFSRQFQRNKGQTETQGIFSACACAIFANWHFFSQSKLRV